MVQGNCTNIYVYIKMMQLIFNMFSIFKILSEVNEFVIFIMMYFGVTQKLITRRHLKRLPNTYNSILHCNISKLFLLILSYLLPMKKF